MSHRAPSRTLIIGCGDLGCRVGARLVARGGAVIGARRRPERLPETFEPISFDVGDPAGWEQLATTAPDSIVFAVAADDGSEPAYRRAYLDGARELVRVFDPLATTLRRVVFVSSSSVYGVDDGSWVDEDSDPTPGDHRGQRLLEAERVIEASALAATRLRLTGIYGPGRTRLIEVVRQSGGPTAPEEPPVWTNRIHVDDAAAAVVSLLDLDEAAPVYLGVDDEPSPRELVLRFIAEKIGASPGLDLSTLKARGNKRCRNARLRATGWTPVYPTYREGYGALLHSG